MLLVIFCYAVLASTFTLAKAALDYARPFFLIGFRMTVAGSALLLYLYFFQRKKFRFLKEDRALFMRVAFFHIYLAFILEFWSLQFISSAKTSLIYSLTPFISAGLSYLLLGHKLTNRKVIALLGGFAGMIPLLALQSGRGAGIDDFLSITFPEIVLLGAVTSAAYAWFDITKLIHKGYSLLMINGFAMLVGGVGAFITSAVVEGIGVQSVSNWPLFLYYVGGLILLSNVIFYNVFGSLLRTYTITLLTFAGFLTPLFAAFFGWFFLGEIITWHYSVSFLIIVGALALFYSEEMHLRIKGLT